MHAFVLLLRLGFAGPSLNYGLNEFQPWLPLTSSCALISVKVVIFTFGFVFFFSFGLRFTRTSFYLMFKSIDQLNTDDLID